MNGFTFLTPPRIRVEWGGIRWLAEEAAALGHAPLVVTGRALRHTGALSRILERLEAGGLSPRLHEGVPPEPDLDALQSCVDAASECDSIIAIGGGSVLDVAKGAAALSGIGADVREYFSGKPIPPTGKPLIAVPTTSGTGSEATWVSVLIDPQTRRKAGIRGTGMMPRVALLDPELTVSCSPSVTAHSGADAFVQAVEAFSSRGANPMTDALALQAARLTAAWLPVAVREPSHREAREAMALGSLLAGMALNTSRLGLVHGLAHPLGVATGAPHGQLCGLLLPPVLRYNRSVSAEKYAWLARELELAGPSDDAETAAEALLRFTEALMTQIGIPLRLRDVGFALADLDWVAHETMPSGSTQANPRVANLEDVRSVVLSCW